MQHNSDVVAPHWGKVRSSIELGQRIATARQDQDLTQSDLASWIAVDCTTVVRLEKGRVGQIERLFEVLGTLGLDVVVVPRNARVVVTPPPS